MEVVFEPADEAALPLIVRPKNGACSANEVFDWVTLSMPELMSKLYLHGGLLFRGFPLQDTDTFERFAKCFGGRVLDYVGGAVPRSRISGNVFNSTEVTRVRRIKVHNELAYQRDYPDLIFFSCALPATSGGQTPIVDCRTIYKDLDPALRLKFEERGMKYVRTFQNRRPLQEFLKRHVVVYRHLTWQGAFKVKTREEVESLCRARGMDFDWRSNGDLVVTNVLPATLRHPVTGDVSWFNQAVVQHFNRKSWGWSEFLFRRVFYLDQSMLPNQAYFGDGSPIHKSEIYHIFDVTYKNIRMFDWEARDVLLLDNRLVAHGREPYSGDRKVHVYMIKQDLATL